MKKLTGYSMLALIVATLIFIFMPRCGERSDKYIAEELAVIADVRNGILALSQHCEKEKNFLMNINEGTFSYECDGKYPKKLSMTYENELTNDIASDNGYPLVLVSFSAIVEHWKSKELGDGRVLIKGPASLSVESAEIDMNHYWLYDPKDGSINFYDDGKLKAEGPFK